MGVKMKIRSIINIAAALVAASSIFVTFHVYAAGPTTFPVGNPISTQQNTSEVGSFIPTTNYRLLNGFSVTTDSTAGYVLIFDATSAPADGSVTPKDCYEIPANQSLAVSWNNNPEPFTTGIVFVFSTTGCFTKTISNTAFFSVQVQ